LDKITPRLYVEYFLGKLFYSAKKRPPGYFRFVFREGKQSFDIFTHMTREELIFLYNFALQIPVNSVLVEIGSYLGASSCFLAAAAKRKKGHLYCVDTWENIGMTEGFRDTFDEFNVNVKKYKSFITPIRDLSKNAVVGWTKPIDILFIDGDHSYEAVSFDLKNWGSKLKKTGYIILHDYGWAKGIQLAVDEFIKPRVIGKSLTIDNLYCASVDWNKITEV